MGSSNTIFRSSNEYVYHIPADPSEETPATDTPQNETDIEDQDALMNNMDKNEVVNDIQGRNRRTGKTISTGNRKRIVRL